MAQTRLGDLDADGQPTVLDLVTLINHISGTRPLSGELQPFGDINEDGVIDQADVDFLADAVLGAVALPNPFSAPLVSVPVTATNGTNILITGTSRPNRTIVVNGGMRTVTTTADSNGNFSLNVPLQANKLNVLFVSATNSAFVSGTPQPLRIIQDSQPPSLFIDFPTDGLDLISSNIVVAGRVGDMLSGFMGLSVVISNLSAQPRFGAAATVDVGIGNNGTFELGEVPLVPGTNVISATGRDLHGNSVTRQVTVRRVIPVGLRMVAVSGDMQMTNAHLRLAQPITVRIESDNGTPFSNKVVTFTVTRSDGRLLAVDTNFLAADISLRTDRTANGVLSLPLFTDGNGYAQAWWTLGGDAGCGNNRVCVSSRDIEGAAYFCASASPMPASQINVGSGDNQRGETGAPAPEPLRAWVNDSCNGVPGIAVTFRMVSGSGRVNGQESIVIPTSRTGHAEVQFTLGPTPGANVVEATFPGNPGAPATFVIYGLSRDPSQPTSFHGVVFDNSSQPIGGARCVLKVGDITLPATFSDSNGQFSFADIPAGPAHLQVDGLPATLLGGIGIPQGTFPALSYSMTVVANADNSLTMPVLLPRMNPNNARVYYGTNDIVLTCEGMAGLKMFVKAGSMRRADGTIPTPQNPAILALNQVHHDDLPMPMPDGASPPFAWTLQPGGSTFDPPITIEYPNMSGLPAGGVAYFLSFNHDTERFEIVASGHVAEDGSKIMTDSGVGLSIAGWGCNCPPYSVTGDCNKCEAAPAPSGGGVYDSTDYQFIEAPFTPHDFPANSITCGETHIGLQKAVPASCSCQGKDYVVRVEITVWVKDKWYNSRITNAADKAYVEKHEDEHIKIAKKFFDDVVIKAININNNKYDKQGPCDLAVETFNKFYADAAAAYNKNKNNPDDAAAEAKCDEIRRRFAPPPPSPQPLSLAAEPAMEPDIFTFDFGEIWTLAVNGQTITTHRLDSFRVRNIAAADLFGPGGPGTRPDFLSDDFYRLTGSSTSNRYVFSDPFQIRQGQAIDLGELTITEFPPPLAEFIQAMPDAAVLTAIGQTTQVRVTARLHDGTTMDVTPRSHWTVYRTSNPAVATVDGDGLVTAHAKGTVFITAVNEGTATVCQIDVAPGDPLTTIHGYVQTTNGTPVNGATIYVIGFAAPPVLSAADGSFVISNVPSTFGSFRLTARKITTTALFGSSGSIEPVPGGITDAGILQLREGVVWVGASGGFWHTATNWSNGQVPGPNTDVYLNVPGLTVTNSQGSNVVRNLLLESPLRVTGGSLRASGMIQANVPLVLAGGTLARSAIFAGTTQAVVSATSGTLDAVTLNGDLEIINGTVSVVNGMTLNGVTYLGSRPSAGNAGILSLNGSQTISGSGAVSFGPNGCNSIRMTQAGTFFTNRVTIHGHSGQVGFSSCVGGPANVGVVNEGSISADGSGGTIFVHAQPLINRGLLQANGGTLNAEGVSGNLGTGLVSVNSHLHVTGTYTNNLGLIANTATLTLDGTWFNAGGVTISNSVLNLAGSFGLGSIGTINRTGGTVNLTGTLNGAGGALTLDAASGSWVINSGTLRNTIVNASGGARLVGVNGTLDGATLNSDLDIPNGTLTLLNGLVLNGIATLGNSVGNIGTLLLNGSQAISGSGTIAFGSSGCNTMRLTTGNTFFTNRITIRGQSGQLAFSSCLGGPANVGLVNEGTISADVSGGTIFVHAQPLINRGVLQANRGTLNAEGLSGNLGNALVSSNGVLHTTGSYTNDLGIIANNTTLSLDGNWFNAGGITISNAVLNLDGTFGLPNVGTINRSGGTVNLTGTLDGAGGTLVLDAASGSWTLNGGTLRNTIVNASGGARLVGVSGTLDRATLSSDLDIPNGTLTLLNGLVLNGIATLGNSVGNIGTLLLNGSQAISGSGTIAFGSSGCNTMRLTTGNTFFTNRITIRGQSGQLAFSSCLGGPANVGLVNEGTISADVSGGTIFVHAQPLINRGVLQANRGTLNAEGLIGNLGSALTSSNGVLHTTGTYTNDLGIIANNTTLSLDGNWFNAGGITISNAVLNLDGTFGLPNVGTINRSGGTVNLTGTLDGAGGTLVLDAASGSWTINGGTLRNTVVSASGGGRLSGISGTLDRVTLNTDLDIPNGTLTLLNGLVLNGIATVGNSVGNIGTLLLNGSQAISGTGTIAFGSSGCNTVRLTGANTFFTNRVVIRGQSGQLAFSACVGGPANVGLVNEGTISADVSGGTIFVHAQPLINRGVLQANRGTLNAEGLIGNLGSALTLSNGVLHTTGTYTNDLGIVANNTTLTLDGNWFNAAGIIISNTVLNLDGTFGLPNIGTINRSGGTVNLTGTLDGTGGTLILDAASGSWTLNGGTLRNTIVNASGGARLVGTSGTLNGVTMDGDMDVLNGSLTLLNGFVLNGTARIGNSAGNIGTLNLNGSQAISGTGTIAFGSSGCNAARLTGDNTIFTNRVVIHGQAGQLAFSTCVGGPINVGVVNEGTISADVNGGTIFIHAQPLLNRGLLQVNNGGTLNADALSGNLGSTAIGSNSVLRLSGAYTNDLGIAISGTTLTLDGTWVNAGGITINNAVLNLGGTFGLGSIGLINRTGGTVNLTGTLNGAGGTLTLDAAAGSWLINGGTLRNTFVNASAGSRLQGTSGTLDAVTLNGDLEILNGTLTVANGLVLNGTAFLGNQVAAGTAGLLSLNGSQAISGSGAISFGRAGCDAVRLSQANTFFTNRVTIHGHSGQIGNSACIGGPLNVGVVNEATISADVNGGTITIRAQPFINNGTTNQLNGGRLVIQ